MTIETSQQNHNACTSYLKDMPWGDCANAMATIELTQECNLSCPYCHPCQSAKAHKSLRNVERELTTISALSQSDTVVLAGGEPLLYPDLEAAVQLVAASGKKPVILTNGILATEERMLTLKTVGLFGVMYHVNARQNRPGWEGCCEGDLNALRLSLANLAELFELHCGFNTLVFPSTLSEVPRVALWASANSEKVHIMTFVAARMFEATITRNEDDVENRGSIYLSPFDVDTATRTDTTVLSSHDLYDQIQKVFPGYRFNSFLGSTAQSGVLKWAMGTHLCRTGKRIGNLGPQAIRAIQTLGRNVTGRDVSHFSPSLAKRGWMVLLMGVFDRETRKTILRHITSAIRKPLELFRTLHLQTFVVMQSIDILPDGERRNCNGCVCKTTENRDRCVREGTQSYVLEGISSVDTPSEDSTQMQWPKQSPSLWRNSELERIGKMMDPNTKFKN